MSQERRVYETQFQPGTTKNNPKLQVKVSTEDEKQGTVLEERRSTMGARKTKTDARPLVVGKSKAGGVNKVLNEPQDTPVKSPILKRVAVEMRKGVGGTIRLIGSGETHAVSGESKSKKSWRLKNDTCIEKKLGWCLDKGQTRSGKWEWCTNYETYGVAVYKKPLGVTFEDGRVTAVERRAATAGVKVGSFIHMVDGQVVGAKTWYDAYLKANAPFVITYRLEGWQRCRCDVLKCSNRHAWSKGQFVKTSTALVVPGRLALPAGTPGKITKNCACAHLRCCVGLQTANDEYQVPRELFGHLRKHQLLPPGQLDKKVLRGPSGIMWDLTYDRKIMGCLQGSVGLYKHHSGGFTQKIAVKEVSKFLVQLKMNRKGKPSCDDILNEIAIYQQLSKLKCPYILKLFDVLEDDNKIYLITRYAANGDGIGFISEAIRRTGGNPVQYQDWCIRTFHHMLVAVQATNNEGICNGDISLENFLFGQNSDQKSAYQKPLLMDFGLAKQYPEKEGLSAADANRHDHTRYNFATSEIGGKVKHSAPEKWALKKLGRGSTQYDAKLADIWSLATCFISMITAQWVVKHPTTADPEYRALTTKRGQDLRNYLYVRWRLALPANGQLLRFIERLFQEDPAARFQSVDEILCDPVFEMMTYQRT